MSVYFRQIGLSASHVGLLIGIRPIIQFASAPFWAIMADRYKKRKPILVMSIFAWLIMTLALAFVEPTTEICEMRIENNSMLQFVNYTKIKTGFFSRRSLTLTGRKSVVNASQLQTFRRKDKRWNADKKGRISMIQSPLTKTNPTTFSAKKHVSPYRASLGPKWRSKSKYLQVNEIAVTSDVKAMDYKTKPAKSTLSNDNALNKRQTIEGVRSNKKILLLRRLSESKAVKDNKTMKTSEKSGDSHIGLSNSDDNFVKEKLLDHLKYHGRLKTNATRPRLHKAKGHSSTVAFSRGDDYTDNSHFPIDKEDGRTTNGSGEDFSGEESNAKKGNVSIPKHVKEAAEKLQRQLTKSINLLNNIAKNSSEVLIHHAIAMFSKKDKGDTVRHNPPKTIPQLSNAINNFVKSSNGYKSVNLDGSGSGIGSSLLLSSDNDLTNLAMSHLNPKDGLNTPDNLHQKESKETLNGVIHHNVLPHHVLAFKRTDTGRLSVTQLLGDSDEYKSAQSGSGEASGEKWLHSKSDSPNPPIILSATDVNIMINNTSLDHQQNDSSKQVGSNSPSAILNVINQANTTLKNLLKSNEHEMSRIFTILLIFIVVGEFLESPSATLADASLLEVLGENRQFYGKQRLFGSIGFGVSSFIVGILLEHSRHLVCGDEYIDYMICFCAFGVMMFITLLITSSFEFHYSDTQSNSGSVFSSLCNVHYGSCLFAACIMGVDFSMSHNFLAWFLEDLGASKSLMGLAVISRCFADTVTFYFAGNIIKQIGQVRVMIMVLISYTVILLIFSTLHNPLWVIPVEILDGITYAMAWSSLTSYLAGAVPADSLTTLQGMTLRALACRMGRDFYYLSNMNTVKPLLSGHPLFNGHLL